MWHEQVRNTIAADSGARYTSAAATVRAASDSGVADAAECAGAAVCGYTDSIVVGADACAGHTAAAAAVFSASDPGCADSSESAIGWSAVVCTDACVSDTVAAAAV